MPLHVISFSQDSHKCGICGKKGHNKRSCKKAKKQHKCSECGKKGHNKLSCKVNEKKKKKQQKAIVRTAVTKTKTENVSLKGPLMVGFQNPLIVENVDSTPVAIVDKLLSYKDRQEKDPKSVEIRAEELLEKAQRVRHDAENQIRHIEEINSVIPIGLGE